MAARQQITRECWDTKRNEFELFISQLVIDEASAGDAAARRLEVLDGLPLLELGEDTNSLSKLLLRELFLPERASSDAVHIALAVVSGIDYLLTWNCTHIANATLRPRIEEACRTLGYRMPIICTPEELKTVFP